MASRWRVGVWAGGSHVDSYAREAEREAQASGLLKMSRVKHDLSWQEMFDLIRNKSLSLSPFLENLIREEREQRQDNDGKCLLGSGRAQMLANNWDSASYRKPGSGHVTSSSNSINGNTSSSCSDRRSSKNTSNENYLYIKNLPANLKPEDLKSTVEAFGVVSHCTVQSTDRATHSIGYVRMEDPSACKWVISYFQGIPFDDVGSPMKCGYVADLPSPPIIEDS